MFWNSFVIIIGIVRDDKVFLIVFRLQTGNFLDKDQHLGLRDVPTTTFRKLLEALKEISFWVIWRFAHLGERVSDERCRFIDIKQAVTIIIEHLPDLIDGLT